MEPWVSRYDTRVSTQYPIYGIKLVTPDHFGWKCFEADFEGQPGLATLMNFKNTPQGISAARRMVPGSCAILYVSREQWFARAFEVIGTIDEGERIAQQFSTPTFDLLSATNPYRVFLPIRWLARVDPDKREDPQRACDLAGIHFKPNSYTFKKLAQEEYLRLYRAINWTWNRESGKKPNDLVAPMLASKSSPCASPIRRSPLHEVWFPEIRQRILDNRPLSERNHEDVVADFLQRLGVPRKHIIFKQGASIFVLAHMTMSCDLLSRLSAI